jgi:hypothetical protein
MAARDPLSYLGLVVLFGGMAGAGAMGSAQGSASLRAALEIGAAAGGVLIPVASLIRISRSRGMLEGTALAGASLLIALALVILIGVPNFMRARARIAECERIMQVSRSFLEKRIQAQASLQEATGSRDQKRVEEATAAYGKVLGEWSGAIQTACSGCGVIASPANELAGAAQLASSLFARMAEAIRQNDAAKIQEVSDQAAKADSGFRQASERFTAICGT